MRVLPARPVEVPESRAIVNAIVNATASAEAVVTALVTAHYAKLCDFVLPLVGSRAAAEDLVQDLFARLWERWETRAPREPVPYLYRSARYLASNYRRHERVVARWGADEMTAAPNATSGGAASDGVYGREFAAAVTQALAALPEGQRQVFLLSRQQELTYAQIAAALELSVKTVETQMTRALKALRLHLAPYIGVVAFLLIAGR